MHSRDSSIPCKRASKVAGRVRQEIATVAGCLSHSLELFLRNILPGEVARSLHDPPFPRDQSPAFPAAEKKVKRYADPREQENRQRPGEDVARIAFLVQHPTDDQEAQSKSEPGQKMDVGKPNQQAESVENRFRDRLPDIMQCFEHPNKSRLSIRRLLCNL